MKPATSKTSLGLGRWRKLSACRPVPPQYGCRCGKGVGYLLIGVSYCTCLKEVLRNTPVYRAWQSLRGRCWDCSGRRCHAMLARPGCPSETRRTQDFGDELRLMGFTNLALAIQHRRRILSLQIRELSWVLLTRRRVSRQTCQAKPPWPDPGSSVISVIATFSRQRRPWDLVEASLSARAHMCKGGETYQKRDQCPTARFACLL